MTMHGDSTVPEQRCQCPGIGTCNRREVNECWQPAVTPVGYPLIKEMEDEDDLGAPEVITGPEEDPDEEEEIVKDEVGSDVGGCRDQHIVLREEVVDVAELGEKEEYPVPSEYDDLISLDVYSVKVG